MDSLFYWIHLYTDTSLIIIFIIQTIHQSWSKSLHLIFRLRQTIRRNRNLRFLILVPCWIILSRYSFLFYCHGLKLSLLYFVFYFSYLILCVPRFWSIIDGVNNKMFLALVAFRLFAPIQILVFACEYNRHVVLKGSNFL